MLQLAAAPAALEAVLVPLSAYIKTLEERVKELELKARNDHSGGNSLRSDLGCERAQVATAEQTAVQAAAAAKTKAAAERSSTYLDDPATAIFWSSRGYSTPPWRWQSTSGILRYASHWPSFLKFLKVDLGGNQLEQSKYYIDCHSRVDIENLKSDASLFAHL